MGWMRRVAPVAAATLAALVLSGCGRGWSTALVSVNAAGSDSGAGYSGDGYAPFTDGGDKVVFASGAGDLGPTDTNGRQDVYIRDLVAGTTELVSVNAAGTDAGDGPSYSPQVSDDGTKVAFISGATDLGPGNTRGGIFVRDLVAGTTTLVTVNGAGSDGSAGYLYRYELSGDGTKVLWPTDADDLGPVDHDRPPYSPEPTRDHDDTDVYVRDLVTQTTSLVSVNAAGTDSADAMTESAWFGADSDTVQFHSAATDLVVGAPPGWGAYRRDLVTGVTTRISLSPEASTIPMPSADGSTLAFSTTADDLGPADGQCSATPPGFPPMPRPCSDVYVRDVATGETTLVSVDSAGVDGGDGDSNLLGISDDGSRVVFESWASDLGPPDAGFDLDVFVRDLATGTTSMVTVNADGTDGLVPTSVNALYVVLGPDLSRVAFGTTASNLGPVDTNGTWDVYVRDLDAGTTVLISDRTDGKDSGNSSSYPDTFSPDGDRLTFRSEASNLVATDTNGRADIFVATVPPPPEP